MTAATTDCGKLTLTVVVKRCMDGLRSKHDDLQGRVSVLETAEYGLQSEVKELRDKVKGLRDEAKEVRDEFSRKRRTDAVDGIEEIEEEARKLKRTCGEI